MTNGPCIKDDTPLSLELEDFVIWVYYPLGFGCLLLVLLVCFIVAELWSLIITNHNNMIFIELYSLFQPWGLFSNFWIVKLQKHSYVYYLFSELQWNNFVYPIL